MTTPATAEVAFPRRLVRRIGPGVVSGLVLLALWIVVAFALRGGYLVPYPWDVVAQFVEDFRVIVLVNTVATGSVALIGLLVGLACVVPTALLVIVFPRVSPMLMQIALVLNVIPAAIIAPMLVVALPGDGPRIALAALGMFFPVLISLILGLSAVDRQTSDVVVAAGGGRWSVLRLLRAKAALPYFLGGVQIGVPAALLGSLLAEFFGTRAGLGLFLIQAQATLDVERVWVITLWVSLLSFLLYQVVAVLRRRVVRWQGEQSSLAITGASADTSRRSRLVAVLGAAVVLLLAWQSLTSVFGLSTFFVKSPLDVLSYLVAGPTTAGIGLSLDPDAGNFWTQFGKAIGVTAGHSLIGFAVGTSLAIVLSFVMVAWPRAERYLMPVATAMQAIPLIAVTPLLAVLFGRGLLTVTIMITLVTFFPTVVTMTSALRAVPRGASEVVVVAGGGATQVSRFVRLFYVLPAMTASARIAVPASISGAVLAEWLASNDGIGRLITIATSRSDFSLLWATGVLLVAFVLICYAGIEALDRTVARRLGVG